MPPRCSVVINIESNALYQRNNHMEFSKFDQLIHYVNESDLSPDEVLAQVIELFPLFDPNSDCYNDKHLSDYNIDLYYYNRSLGLPVVEVANSINLTATLLSKLFLGERVSLTKLVNLAQAEVFALAGQKATHLSMLEKTEGINGNVTFLEKAFSAQYGDRKQIDINSGFGAKEDNQWNVTIHHVENKIAEASDIAELKRKETTGE